jgi:flagellar protein FlaF
MSVDVYRRQQEITETPREAERRALSMVIGKLLEAKDQGGSALAEACYLNERLWNVFRADLSMPENGLPAPLKAQLLSLALWVQRYTSQVIRGEAELDPLIAVNRNIYEGLMPPARSAPATASATSEAV